MLKEIVVRYFSHGGFNKYSLHVYMLNGIGPGFWGLCLSTFFSDQSQTSCVGSLFNCCYELCNIMFVHLRPLTMLPVNESSLNTFYKYHETQTYTIIHIFSVQLLKMVFIFSILDKNPVQVERCI